MEAGINVNQQDIVRWNINEPRLYVSDFQRIRSWGLTCVQVVVGWRWIEPTTAGYDEAFLSQLDVVIQRATAAGLDIYLKIVVDPYAAWHNLEALWANIGIQDRFVQLWEMLTRRYKGYPRVKGFQLMNEPCVKNDYTSYDPAEIEATVGSQWNKGGLSDRTIAAIRQIDTTRQILMTFGQWGSPKNFATAAPRPFSNVVYAYSWYLPHNVTHEGVSWTGNAATIEADMKGTIDFRDKYHVPIMAQELGINWRGYPSDPTRIAWVDTSLQVLNRQRTPWIYHEYCLDVPPGTTNHPFSIVTPTDYPAGPGRTEYDPIVSLIKIKF